jgi:hypothetical protein
MSWVLDVLDVRDRNAYQPHYLSAIALVNAEASCDTAHWLAWCGRSGVHEEMPTRICGCHHQWRRARVGIPYSRSRTGKQANQMRRRGLDASADGDGALPRDVTTCPPVRRPPATMRVAVSVH